MNKEEIARQIAAFLDAQGRVKVFPAKRRARLLALAYISTALEPERIYTEREVNALIDALHSFNDFFILRRELVENGFLWRDRRGSQYRLQTYWPPIMAQFV